jgi:hypothetical protein
MFKINSHSRVKPRFTNEVLETETRRYNYSTNTHEMLYQLACLEAMRIGTSAIGVAPFKSFASRTMV